MGKGERVLDGSVYVALGSQMDDSVHLLVLHQLIESVEVANVHLDKLIVGLLFYILQVSEVARICQFIKINDVVFGIFVHE